MDGNLAKVELAVSRSSLGFFGSSFPALEFTSDGRRVVYSDRVDGKDGGEEAHLFTTAVDGSRAPITLSQGAFNGAVLFTLSQSLQRAGCAVGLPCSAIRKIASLRLRRTGKPWLLLLRVLPCKCASSARLATTHPAGSRLAGDFFTDPERAPRTPMNERWTLETAPSVAAPEAAIREASWAEAQPWCNFVLLAPTVLPPGTTLERTTLRPEAPPGRVEGAAPDGRPAWSSANRACFCFELAGPGRRLRGKEFLYDWAPAAFDHPSLWKSRNRGFPVGAHVGWIGSDFRKRPGASLHIERTMTELSVLEGAFSDEELAAVCRGLAPAVPEAREIIARTSLADLSYAARHVERIIEVPVGYFRHHRSQPHVPVTLFNGEDAPLELPGRSLRPPDDAYRLDSTFVYGDVDDPQEVDFAHVRKDDHGSYLRVLASRAAASTPGGIPYPPDLDQQPCSKEVLSVAGRDVHYAFLDERWGPHEVVFQRAGENVMVLAKPAAWRNRAWFLDLLREWA